MLDIEYGNISQAEANQLGLASVRPVNADVSALAVEHHQPGDTEPWISRLVGDLIVARGARTVLETGCFKGATSVYIVDALQRLGGDRIFHVCEIDASRGLDTYHRLYKNGAPECPHIHFHKGDVLAYLRLTADRFDLAWVDDNHEKPHVSEELRLLYPKTNKGGLILLHDVYGSCDLRTVVREFGGYSLDFPRLGPAGGLGIIQCL